MKKISILSLTILLGICIACQRVDVPLQAATPSDAVQSLGTPTPTGEIRLPETPTPTGEIRLPKTPTPTTMMPPGEDANGMITFYSHRDGNLEIYIMNADGSSQRRLTFNEFGDDSPAISPDGSQIAFISDRNDPTSGTCSHDCFYQLYIINVNGSGERRLLTSEFSTHHPDWHPDGKKISFDTEANLHGDIYVVHADGSNLQRLIEDGFWADWSPDGTQIVFASTRDGNVELYLADADGSNQHRLTHNGRLDYFPDWSPNGQQIAFAVMEDKAIYIMDANGSNEQRLTPQGNAENPAWSPDGNWIAYQSSNDGDFEIYVINVSEFLYGNADIHAHPLTDNQIGDLWPSWGPAGLTTSGGMLTFEKSNQAFASIPTWQIGLADLDADSDLDAVFANAQSNDSQIWLNDGSGTFTDTGQILGKYGHGVAIGDVDGDGDLDIVITTHEHMPTRVYLNDGQAVFQELEEAFSETTGHSVDLFDIDGDSDLDAVGEGSGIVSIFWNDGRGRFINGGLSFPATSIWGNLDSDEDIDLFIKEDGVGYTVYLNNGSGRFTPYWTLVDPNAMGIGDMGLGDVDADGDLDVVITNGFHQSTSYPARIFINDGTGQFADNGQQLSAVTNAGVSLGDLDGDGDLDLVLTDYMEACQIWLNDGNGQFVDSGLRFGDGQFYRHTHLGDLDGDGDLDIFLASFGLDKGPNEIWFNAKH
ncbi:MAG: VCBS repeat-containing protein [Anaerolineales bacterium]|nr:VCBS repeat-containing protein [Anaerolineales bacterium]